jgi:hypothetical protein
MGQWVNGWGLVLSGDLVAYRSAAAAEHALVGLVVPDFLAGRPEFDDLPLFMRADALGELDGFEHEIEVVMPRRSAVFVPLKPRPEPEPPVVRREPPLVRPELPISSPEPLQPMEETERETPPVPFIEARPMPPSPRPVHFPTVFSTRELSAILPLELPPHAFATILLLASDGSTAAEYARRRFAIARQTALCDHFVSPSGELYLLITTDQLHPSAAVALNCNEFKGNVPGVRFAVNSGLDDDIAFAACLRKAIRQAVSPFAPFNISALVHSLLTGLFEKLMAPTWCLASGNAVISVINAAIEALVGALRSPRFLRFLVPFEHELVSFEDFTEYLNVISRLRLPLLPGSSSHQRLVGMTWVDCVRQNTSIDLAHFVVPVGTDFDETAFVGNILLDVDLHGPSETVPGFIAADDTKFSLGWPSRTY